MPPRPVSLPCCCPNTQTTKDNKNTCLGVLPRQVFLMHNAKCKMQNLIVIARLYLPPGGKVAERSEVG